MPLAIWPCAQRTCQQQRRGRYLPGSGRCAGEMLPELARRAITTYSDPGDLVVDPACRAGTTLAEAVRLDRDAIGIDPDGRRVDLASANVAKARSDGAPGRARALTGDARELPRILASQEARTLQEPIASKVARLPYASVDLVLTSVTPAQATRPTVAEAAAAVVRPGGFVVIVVKHPCGGNLLGDVVELYQRAGLHYWQHVVGLVAAIRGGELRSCLTRRQCPHTRQTRAPKRRTHRIVHDDVLVFRRPVGSGESTKGAEQ